MFKAILLIALAIVWILFGVFGYKTETKSFKKYKKYKSLDNLDPKHIGLVRSDYKNWNKQKIIIGCFTLFPLRLILFISILPAGFFLAFLIKLTNYSSFATSMLFFYIRTFGRFVVLLMCNIREQFQNKKLLAPIIISNHVNWYDIFYFQFRYCPISFVAKKQVESWPVFGIFAKVFSCIFLNRNNQNARKQTRQLIKQRIQDINKLKKDSYPLLIFPQGTTSNGKALLTFKNGAFENRSAITAFCLQYKCQNFSVGLDELDQIQHVVLMMSQFTTLIVKRLQFEPQFQQNAEEYENRIRNQMAQILNIPCTQGGYRDVAVLKEIRKGRDDLKVN